MGNFASTSLPKTEFGSSTTAEQVVTKRGTELKGKNVLITGASAGIGAETARVLAQKGATVYMGCRNAEKTQGVIDKIVKSTGNEDIHIIVMDLADLESVRNAAAEFKAKDIPLHILINNAGIMACPYSTTKDGFEMQIGTNHFGHFVLTNELRDSLRRGGPGARVVVLSSRAHHSGGVDLNDINWETRSYDRTGAYAQSKSANILFAVELNRQFAEEGAGVTVNAVHPGVIDTELSRHWGMAQFFYSIAKPFLKSIPQGAATTVYCAVAEELDGVGGKYFADCNEAPAKVYAVDPEIAKKFWTASFELMQQRVAKSKL
eukprot:TRINITY_DN4092_c0_g1_i1.p1 TRINITY_DN4092_c0_g1~~TRINITY_DN4092_c0_g1_i1.p1  ORF type:complete len:337 (-),score=73.64 TRINITY_DN4092_c0_g1_i1:92-1048(-)